MQPQSLKNIRCLFCFSHSHFLSSFQQSQDPLRSLCLGRTLHIGFLLFLGMELMEQMSQFLRVLNFLSVVRVQEFLIKKLFSSRALQVIGAKLDHNRTDEEGFIFLPILSFPQQRRFVCCHIHAMHFGPKLFRLVEFRQ